MADDLVERGMRGELQPGTGEYEEFIDRTARRPRGVEEGARWRNPTEHYADFDLALEMLQLTADDRYLEIGFGGGQLLEAALKTVHSAAGIDHSPDMLALASERNVKAIVDGRLQLVYGDLLQLPWPDRQFTAAACTNVFFFVEQPERCLHELYRVLKPGGRLVIVTAAQAAGPWVVALRTYTIDQMREMHEHVGFRDVTVENRGTRQVSVARR